MQSNRNKSRTQSKSIALCGMMTALTIVLMVAGGLIPVATYCVPMAAGILLLPILLEYGKKTAWTTYAAASLIALLLGVDKEAAFFYVFFGHYPLLKWELDRIRSIPLRFTAKILMYNLSFAAMYALLGLVMNMDALLQEFTQMGFYVLAAFVLLFNLCMLLYDRLIMPLAIIYIKKLRPRFHFLLK